MQNTSLGQRLLFRTDRPDTSESIGFGIYPELNFNQLQISKQQINPFIGTHASTSGSIQASVGASVQRVDGKWYNGYTLSFGSSTSSIPYTFEGYTLKLISTTNKLIYTPNIFGRTVYHPNKWIKLELGNDQHFFGDGYRSLVQSDQIGPNPFFTAKTQFWKLRYGIMYQAFFDQAPYPLKWKANALHYLTFKPNKKWRFTLIESLQILTKDSTFNRGFDVEYLNPFVFFRPQEYSLGSSDNVLLAAMITYKKKSTTVYAQLALDDFSVAELKAKQKWWGNKFALQLGVNQTFKKIGILRSELNVIRPYMYAHISNALNFGHQGFAIAHPDGANLAEWLTIFYCKKGNYNLTFYNQLGVKGYDSLPNKSYGGDIYKSYDTRPADKEYGTRIGQGITRQNWKIQFQIDKDFKKNALNVYALVGNNLIWGELNTKSVPFIQIGLRSILYNRTKLF